MQLMTEEKKDDIFDDGMISKLQEFMAPEQLYQDLIERVRKYHPSDEITMISKA